MDQGWIKANGPFESDEEESFVSDDDGDPSESRITPAVFRALAAGCTLDGVDSLRRPMSEAPSLRPVTPQDKILDVSKDTTHHNNVAPYCHRRQFDIHTGEELSPAYRVEQGPSSSTLWTPPGVTPERAGLYLLLLQEGQGEQQQPVRGSGMPALFQRMAPIDCQELRTRLYGGPQREDPVTLSPSSTPSSSSGSFLLSDSEGNNDNKGQNENRRTMTFAWSEVNEAVQNCNFDPVTASLTAIGVNNSPRKSAAASSTKSGSSSVRNMTATALATERALLQTFHDSWHAIQTGQAADARLVAANEEAQAAITAQARCLASVEHQLELCRAAELARECQEAQAHYRQQCRIERKAAHKERRLICRRQRIIRGINDHLRSLRTTVGETEARLARGRELQTVLTQRLRDGEARLERLCRDHGVADVAALSKVLSDKLAQLGVEEEE
ncbi:hypothetical protein SEUCBS140593_003282 [Sporothrix eucalyptigena]|uniref:Uncharacterized protein n=1 Tax=Sporothrix eucalyptigena TaxID=1812306 RepID=A0ABP0BDM5_9PEZI